MNTSAGLVQWTGTVSDVYYVKFCRVSGFFFIYAAYIVDKGINGIIFHNADGTSAESAAGDTGTIDTRNLPCQFSKNIGFFAGSFIVITQRNMGFIDQLSEGDNIICFQCFYCMDRSLVFVNCMFCPFLADGILNGILTRLCFTLLLVMTMRASGSFTGAYS